MFKAIQIDRSDDGQTVKLADIDRTELPHDKLLIQVDYSTLNYKDGLALSGASPVVRTFPMVPGIDLAGTVLESQDPRWQPGDRVVVNGWGMGEVHWGGLAQLAAVDPVWPVKLPDSIDSRTAMAIGTAGYTAALCVDALVDHGIEPSAGDILVTGASGGVGSVAIALLAAAGFRVIASTGKTTEREYLEDLGAADIIDRESLSEKGKPLQKERWAGVVDAVGGQTLANACAATQYRGAVAACGLAESPSLPATVMPFILRGITLYGIDSVMAPMHVRIRAWERLERDLNRAKLESMVTEIALGDAPGMASELLSGKVRGRLLVNVNR